jgi:Kef-type K+ transport system membrane component KefB
MGARAAASTPPPSDWPRVWGVARAWGVAPREAQALGWLMNTRGLTELVVLNVGLSLGVNSPELFTMGVIMAVLTTAMAGPMLNGLGYGRVKDPEPSRLCVE